LRFLIIFELRISYGNFVCLSVRLSVLVSRPGTESNPGEIENPGFHHMVAYGLWVRRIPSNEGIKEG